MRAILLGGPKWEGEVVLAAGRDDASTRVRENVAADGLLEEGEQSR